MKTKWLISILISLATLLLTATTARASDLFDRSFFHSVTPSVSILSSGFSGDDAEEFSPHSGYAVSAMFEGGHGPVCLETGLTYREGGGTLREFYRGHELSDEILLKYLDVPATAKYYIRVLSRSMIYAKAGAKASILIDRGQSGLDSSFAVVTNDEGAPLVENFMPFSLSGILGIGGRVKLGNNTDLALELAYHQGFTPIQGDESFYDYSVALTTGVKISLL